MPLTETMQARTLEILQDLIRINTTNPPGNEMLVAQYLRDLLTPYGVETEIIESAPGRGNFCGRLRGSGAAKPLMIMGHMDVVAADPDDWTFPPFEPTIHDGFLWGRGSTDNKQMIAVGAAILMTLAEQDTPLARDVVLCGAADEEHGGHLGMGWLARKRPELLDVAGVLNEGGGGAFRAGDRLVFTCQTAEKGVCRTVWTATAPGGHGSAPRRDLATTKLARALGRLGDGYIRQDLISTMRQAIISIAAADSERLERRVGRMLDQGRVEDALAAVGISASQAPRARALFYDTASVTGLRAGDPVSINVIPLTAQAYVDGRILPGQTLEGFVKELQAIAGDDAHVSLYEGQYSAGLESSADTPLFDAIKETVAEHYPGALVVPWTCAGSTDAKHVVPLGTPVYGFIPMPPLPKGIVAAGAHAADERMWLDNLCIAADMLYDITIRFAAQ